MIGGGATHEIGLAGGDRVARHVPDDEVGVDAAEGQQLLVGAEGVAARRRRHAQPRRTLGAQAALLRRRVPRRRHASPSALHRFPLHRADSTRSVTDESINFT